MHINFLAVIVAGVSYFLVGMVVAGIILALWR